MLLSNTDGFFDEVFQLVKEKFIFLKKDMEGRRFTL